MCYRHGVKPDRWDEFVAKRAPTMHPEIGILALQEAIGDTHPIRCLVRFTPLGLSNVDLVVSDPLRKRHRI